MSKIEKELLEATGLKKKVAEKRQVYLERLIGAVQDLNDAKWEAVSEKGQKWVNAGAKIINDDKGDDIPDFPDAKGADDKEEARPTRTGRRGADTAKEEEGEAGESGESEENESRGSRRSGKGKDKEPPARSSRRGKEAEEEAPVRTSRRGGKEDEKPARAAKPQKERKGGAQVAIKTAVIKNPKATTEDIAAALEKKGLDVTPSAVSTIRSGTLQTLRLVKELGMPKGEF